MPSVKQVLLVALASSLVPVWGGRIRVVEGGRRGGGRCPYYRVSCVSDEIASLMASPSEASTTVG
jgi:hypothetical protein